MRFTPIFPSQFSSTPETFYRKPLPPSGVSLTSKSGRERFKTALLTGNAEAFFPLIGQYQTQSHPAYCGITSLCMVLNTLKIDPGRLWLPPWRWFMEASMGCCFNLWKVKSCGVTVDVVASAGRAHSAEVSVLRGLSVDDGRKVIKRCVGGVGEYVIASYDRPSLGQTGTGHFSPIAAYDEDSDSALILDVARFKYGPHWVSVKDIVEATWPDDPDTGLPRGFLVMSKASTKTGSGSHNGPESGPRFCSSKLFWLSGLVVVLSFAGWYVYR